LRYDWPPGMPYHETKRDSEVVALRAAGEGMEVVVLSPALVLGPGEPRPRFLTLVRLLQRGLGLVAPPGGSTLCDVRDVADIHVTALQMGRSGQRYILGGPHVPHIELMRLFAEAVGAPRPRLVVPRWAVRGVAMALGGV